MSTQPTMSPENKLEALRRKISEEGALTVSKEERLAVLPPGSRIARGGKTYINWTFVRNEFSMGNAFTDPVSGMTYIKYPELRELGYKYGLNQNTLYQKSSRENWGLMRDSFRTKFQDKLTDVNLNSFVSSSAEYDAKILDAVKKVFRLIEVYLRKFGNDIFEEEDGMISFQPDNLPEDCILNIKEIDGLLSVLEKAHSLVRKIVGDSEAQNTVKNLMEEIKKEKDKNKKTKSADISKLVEKELISRKAMAKQLEQLKMEANANTKG